VETNERREKEEKKKKKKDRKKKKVVGSTPDLSQFHALPQKKRHNQDDLNDISENPF